MVIYQNKINFDKVGFRLNHAIMKRPKLSEIKVKILYSYFDQKGEKTEELESIPTGENLFRIVQIPVNALGISKDDEVEAFVLSDENLPEFIRFTKKSGNVTISIQKFPNEKVKNKVIEKLDKEFCQQVEIGDKMNVNILQLADIDEIQNYLFANEVSFQMMNPNPFDGKLVIPF